MLKNNQFSTILLFTLFAMLVAVLISVRDAHLQRDIAEGYSPPDYSILKSDDANCLPQCLRVGFKIVHAGVSKIIVGIAENFTTYDPKSFGGEGTLYSDTRLSHLMTNLIAKLLVLLPVLIVAIYLFDRLWTKATFLFLTFLTLAGWGPWLYVSWYRFIGQFFDWPRAWWDFRQVMVAYDFQSIGIVFLLLVYLSLRQQIRLWELIMLTVVAQLSFENLGFVTGVSVFIFTLLSNQRGPLRVRLELALVRLAVCGVTSIAVFFALVSAQGVEVAASATSTPVGEHLNSVKEYFQSYWQDYGRVNFEGFSILVANAISLMWPPLVFGAIFGLSQFAFRSRSDITDEQIVVRARAGFSVVLAFALSMGVGLFVSGMHSELGRQILPLISVLVFASSYGAMQITLLFRGR